MFNFSSLTAFCRVIDDHEVRLFSHLLFFHKVDVGGAFDFHWLTLPVVQRQHEVKEVGLPQVGRRLLLEVSSG